ncbi:5-aminolevulinate synthase, nonspecific, mitochondrial [Varanus komodoensis]|nr:5-aminolevulinate synthase, nonspecific, mitochondrial [Varanus komodoensis]
MYTVGELNFKECLCIMHNKSTSVLLTSKRPLFAFYGKHHFIFKEHAKIKSLKPFSEWFWSLGGGGSLSFLPSFLPAFLPSFLQYISPKEVSSTVMVVILAMQEGAVALLAMGPTTKVVTTALLLLLSMLERSSSMEDNRSLPMAQVISPIKASSSNRITRTSIATMAHHKANRRDTTRATMLPTQIPTTPLVAAVEDQTTTMKVMVAEVEAADVVAQITTVQEVPPTMPVAMGEELGEEGHLTKVDILSQTTTRQLQTRITVDLPIPTKPPNLAMAEMTTA